ncbi:MAG TPA: helix-turn-helix domain-containing protein [Polyangiaceae bacterium]|nr:helix-turn-helix domain-containing protein [Polyangiaceae bacterium]
MLRTPPAALAQILGFKFQALGIGLTLRDAKDWHAISTSENVGAFEFGHGKDTERLAYNRRQIALALRQQRTLLAPHAGFWDLFVPIPNVRDPILITGPFLRARPTSADVLTHWHWLTGRQGHPSDLEFAHYLSVTLATLTLEGELLTRYQRLVECYAGLLSGRGEPALFSEASAHAFELQRVRAVESVWTAAREMVDETTATAWRSPQMRENWAAMGVSGFPEHVLVALVASTGKEPDPVGRLLRLNAFQRASVGWARKERAIVGRVGEHGVMFLVCEKRPQARVRLMFEQLSARISAQARREFGLSIHLGASSATSRAPLGERYRQALAAAEQALSRGLHLVIGASEATRSPSLVRQLRTELSVAAKVQPRTLPSAFEQYIEAVRLEAGYRIDLVRAHLEAGFDHAAEALLVTGALGPKDYQAMCNDLDRAARDSVTVKDLVAAYRASISELAELAEQPVHASQSRSLRRAMTFVEQHFAEPLTVRQVARISGFAPAYFGQLFKQRERTTFQLYLRTLRIEHAKRLLASTELSTERIAQLSGFAERHYFYRVFKLVTRVTPNEYRSASKR